MKLNILWQDNKVAEKMAKNRKMSYSSKSRHIRIKLFWVDDKVKQKNIIVKHWPTEKMLTDFFAKPLQGSKFKIFRWVIMVLDDVAMLWENSNDKDKVSSISKDRVEDTVNKLDVDDGHT